MAAAPVPALTRAHPDELHSAVPVHAPPSVHRPAAAHAPQPWALRRRAAAASKPRPACPAFCSSSLHGNPHSEAGWGECRSAAADAARWATLRMCNADPEQYACIFTAGATGGHGTDIITRDKWCLVCPQTRHCGSRAARGQQDGLRQHPHQTTWLDQHHDSLAAAGMALLPPSCCDSSARSPRRLLGTTKQVLDLRQSGPPILLGAPLPAAALKLVGESFPWRPASAFLYLRDNHNSVLGIRQLAAQHGAACTAAVQLRAAGGGAGERCRWQLAPCSEAAAAGLRAAAAASTAASSSGACPVEHLFAFPLESNFSGVRYDPGLVAAVQSGRLRCCSTGGAGSPELAASRGTAEGHGALEAAAGDGGAALPPGRWRVLLDCAKACASTPPDLAACPADFAVLSYYKIFGYPTGGWPYGRESRGGGENLVRRLQASCPARPAPQHASMPRQLGAATRVRAAPYETGPGPGMAAGAQLCRVVQCRAVEM